MNTYSFAPRSLRHDADWDVIIAGGGPAGCAAAIASARNGARTLLLEAGGCLGGMATAGLVTCWCPFSDGEKIIYRGIAEEVFRASRSSVPHIDPNRLDWVPFDPETLKVIYDDLLTAAGVEVRFFSQAVAVDVIDGKVNAMMIASKGGLTAASARIYVDATGDGDLCAWAGAEYTIGDSQGMVQPCSHCFVLTNVDDYAYRYAPGPYHGDADSPMQRISRSAAYPLVKDTHLCNSPIGPGAIGFNAGHLWEVDSTDPGSLSRAMMDGRKLARQLRDGLAAEMPATYGNSYLVQTAPRLGVRESRIIIGDYVLTLADYQARRSFADEICRNSYPIDIHTTKNEAETGSQVHAMDRYERFRPGESHGIPYRCLTPKGLTNVLVAGRCISTDRAVQGSTRVMPVCLAMGHAAGLAATMAAAGNVHAVDTDELRRRLRKEGAYLPETAP